MPDSSEEVAGRAELASKEESLINCADKHSESHPLSVNTTDSFPSVAKCRSSSTQSVAILCRGPAAVLQGEFTVWLELQRAARGILGLLQEGTGACSES